MEQTTSTSPNLFKHALKSGAIIGGIGIAITAILYVVDLSLLANLKVGIVMILVFLGLVIYMGINYRKEAGGYLSYGKAFQHGYVTLLVSGFISTLFQILLYHVIDPSIPGALTDISLEMAEEMMAGFGMSGDQLDKAMEQARIDTPARFTVVGLLKQFAWGFLIYAIISVITSIFVKKNEPVTM
jgi:hypothetical protein